MSKKYPNDKSLPELKIKFEKFLPLSSEHFGVDITMAKDVIPKSQPWFWNKIIPLDTSTLFAGFGNSGKSQLLIFIAAHVSSGKSFRAFGAEHKFDQGGVILLSGEDDPEYQLVPKLIAAEADLSKIYILKMMKLPNKPKELLDLYAHLSLFEDTIIKAKEENNEIKFVVLDPVQYFIGEMKDHNPVVCRFIAVINDICKKYNLALIMNKHLRKKGTGESISTAIDSVSGSGAWTTSPRSCWLIQRHPIKEGVILIADLKGNLREKNKKSYAYKIESAVIDNPYDKTKKIETTRLVWLDEMEDFNADQALNAVPLSSIEQEIRKWIIDFLLDCNKNPNNGAMFSASELYKEAMSSGYKKATYYKVRKEMIEAGSLQEVIEGKGKKVEMLKLVDPFSY